MSLLAFSPVLFAASLSAAALFSTAQVATPAATPAPPATSDPRALLADEYRRLEALQAQVKAAERAAAAAKESAAQSAATATLTPAARVRPGPRATMLAPVHLQPATGVDSAARGLTPENEWRQMFPQR